MMDQETAKKVLSCSAWMLVLPSSSINEFNHNRNNGNGNSDGGKNSIEFGIDCNEWVTGPKFKGIKMIPPGLHCVFYG